MGSLLVGIYVFVLAVFVGIEIITKIPPTLHTPLMSGANAISGITLVGALASATTGYPTVANVLGCLAIRGIEDLKGSGSVLVGHPGKRVDPLDVVDHRGRHLEVALGAPGERAAGEQQTAGPMRHVSGHGSFLCLLERDAYAEPEDTDCVLGGRVRRIDDELIIRRDLDRRSELKPVEDFRDPLAA